MDYQSQRFGSASVASLEALKRAGLLTGKGISIGFADKQGRFELRNPNDGSLALFGGAGCGKSAALFANNLIGGHIPNNFICFDPRGELASISMLILTLQGYDIYYLNHTGMLGLPKHRCNPLDHLSLDSTTLIADIQKFAADYCPVPSVGQNAWPVRDAQQWLLDLTLYDVELNGVANLSSLFKLIMSIQGDFEAFCAHLERMLHSRFESVRTFAGTIMTLQQHGNDSFTAPLSVLLSSFAFMRDPSLQWQFSGNDCSMRDLIDPMRKVAIFVIWPIEHLKIQSPAIRATLGSAIQYKLRTPESKSVSILVDEAGQLGYFPSIRELFTFGRGAGLTNNIVAWQEISQIKASFKQEANEIIGSAALRVFKGVRTIETATLVSQMAGTMTLSYDAKIQQSEAQRLKRHAVQRLLAGESMMNATADLRHYQASTQHQEKQARQVLKPDEVLNLGASNMVAFASELIEAPIMGHWLKHYERRDFAGKYLNNPYHGERVQIKTLLGSKRCRIIEEEVPAKFASRPQYQNGTWRFVKGYRPKV